MRFQWGQVRPGEIGVVDRAEDGHAYVDFPSQSRWHGLVQELEVEQTADKVRVGARVRVRKGVQPSRGWGALQADNVSD